MKITAIKAQVKNPDRVSVYVDDKYSFSLNHNQLLELRLHSGREVSEQELVEFKKASDYGKMLERTINFVMIRPRSVKEVREYFRRKQTDPDTAERVMHYLENRQYVDDAAFARSWIRSRQLTKAMSQRRLVMELRHKGVSEQIVTEAMADNDYDEADSLRQMIQKKRRIARYRDDPQKLIAYLARQGFGYDDIKNALAMELDSADGAAYN